MAITMESQIEQHNHPVLIVQKGFKDFLESLDKWPVALPSVVELMILNLDKKEKLNEEQIK